MQDIAYTLFGEAMCSVAFDGGPEQTRADSWNLAVARFDAAISGGQWRYPECG